MGFSLIQVYKPSSYSKPPYEEIGYVASECRFEDWTEKDKSQTLRLLVGDQRSEITISDVVFHPSPVEEPESDYSGLPPDYTTENGWRVWRKRV
jgi:hypothetical protein